MTFKPLITAIVLLLGTIFTSCRTGRTDSYDASKLTTYDVNINNNFNSICVANNISVDYIVDDKISLTLNTTAENRENVKIKVEDGVLILKTEQKASQILKNSSAPVKIRLLAPAVGSLTALNNAEIYVSGTYETNAINITATNNADIIFKTKATINEITLTATNNAEIEFKNVKAVSLTATATNNADITLNGVSDNALLTATNIADISASSFLVKSAVCTATNLADISVNAESISSTTRNKGSITNKH